MEIYEMENEVVEKTGNKIEPESKILSLTNQQKLDILKRWNDESLSPPSIDELMRLAFPDDKEFDARSKKGILVKSFLVEKGLKVVAPPSKSEFELEEHQKEYITNNCVNMKPIEMARILFNDLKITGGDGRLKAVNAFLRTIDPKILYGGEVPEDDYSPPRTVSRIVSRIRKYVEIAKNWDSEKLTPTQKKCVEALGNYLASFRFKHQIDSYTEQKDKSLFESSFITYTYDKDDLTQENCDQYILLCSEIIMASNIQDTINMLQREQDRALNEDGKLNMGIVESVKTARQEYNSCIKRQKDLYNMLVQERSEKMSAEIKDKATLLNLFSAWKNYESRQQILKVRQKQKDNLRKEIHEIENMDEMKMRVLGLSIDEIIDG